MTTRVLRGHRAVGGGVIVVEGAVVDGHEAENTGDVVDVLEVAVDNLRTKGPATTRRGERGRTEEKKVGHAV
jgi:hypothetical protein